ncbi:unnamed protein product [Rhodiola kirilowii]
MNWIRRRKIRIYSFPLPLDPSHLSELRSLEQIYDIHAIIAAEPYPHT